MRISAFTSNCEETEMQLAEIQADGKVSRCESEEECLCGLETR